MYKRQREPCSCGRTLVRMEKVVGRSDDMLIIRGVNVFPSQIESVLMNLGMAPHYLLVVDRVDNLDTCLLYTSLYPGGAHLGEDGVDPY